MKPSDWPDEQAIDAPDSALAYRQPIAHATQSESAGPVEMPS
jgi:hypothetical protein